jgi:hypothetical protein
MGRPLHLKIGFDPAHQVLRMTTLVDASSHASRRQVLRMVSQWRCQVMPATGRCYARWLIHWYLVVDDNGWKRDEGTCGFSRV